MKVIVPHKDTIFLLSKVQREFISAYNTTSYAFPQYPLWCFLTPEDEQQLSSATKITSLEIQAPAFEGTVFFFPVLIAIAGDASTEGNVSLKTSRIVFAKTDDSIKKALDFSLLEKSDAFPLHPRVFRIGEASVENNGWSLTDDHWVKLS